MNVLTLDPPSFGLDISEDDIKFVMLESSKHGFKLISYGEIPLKKGVIEKGEIKDQKKLSAAMKKIPQAAKGGKVNTPYAAVSLPEEHAFLNVIQLPRMEESAVGEAVRFEAENHVPYPLDTVYLDHAVIPSDAPPDNHMDVLLASLPRDVVDPYLETLDGAGIVPIALEVESLALSRSLVPGEKTKEPVMILDIGSFKTSVSVFAGSSTRFTTSIPVASAQFTSAISKTLGITEKKAEKMKIEYGVADRDSKEGREVFDALVPSLTDFVEQVKKYVDYYSSHAEHQHLKKGGANIDKIMICGGGSLLKGLPAFLTQSLRVNTEQADPWINIDLPKAPELSYQGSLRYATAIGLASRAAKQTFLV